MSGDKQFQKTFTRRTKPASNGGHVQKRHKEKSKGKEAVAVREVNAEPLVVPSSIVESELEKDQGRKAIENGDGGSNGVLKAAKQKRKSGEGDEKQKPKKKKQKQEKESKQVKEKKGEDVEVKSREKEEEKKEKGKEEGDGTHGSVVKKKAEKKKKREVEERRKDGEEEEGGTVCRFPMSRVDRLIRSQTSDYRIAHEAVFLINKAAEKFLEVFCKDSYDTMAQDCKSSVSYKHLSTVVGADKRFDFLSDYVPEKVLAEKALAETKPAEKAP